MLRLFFILGLLSISGCSENRQDVDGDGVSNDSDNCVSVANADQADRDGDGLGDACDGQPENPQFTVTEQVVQPTLKSSNGAHSIETGGRIAVTVSTNGQYIMEARVTR